MSAKKVSPIKWPQTAETSITIGLMGDVMIGRLVGVAQINLPPQHIWGDVLPFLLGTDLNIINLETTITKSTHVVPKVFNFKAHPSLVECLKVANIHVANLANNHILDFGEEGLCETIEILDRASIVHVGAGANKKEARKPAIITRKRIRIGIIGITDNEPSWEATETKPGTNFLDPETACSDFYDDIRELKEKVDLVIASMHMGPNMVQEPFPFHVRLAHEVVERGVDVIHGHSAHIFQGVEVFKNRPILHDTGDFVDDYMVDPSLRNDRSFFFFLEVGEKGPLSLSLVPTLISDCQVNLAKGPDITETMERMRLLSKKFNTSLVVRQEPVPHLFIDFSLQVSL